MRSTYKTLLACMAVAFALSAVASATASAAPQYKINGKAFTGTETTTAKLSSSNLKIELVYDLQREGTVTCTGASTTGGSIFASFKGNVEKLVFTGCKVTYPAAGCKLYNKSGAPTETIETVALGSEVVEEGGKSFVKIISSVSSHPFMTVYMEGGLCQAEVVTVKGSARCQALTSVEEVSKGCEFSTASGSALKWLSETSPVQLTASVGFTLSGVDKGLVWGLS